MLFSPKELGFVVNALWQRLSVWFVSAKIPTLTVVARQMFPWKDMREKEELETVQSPVPLAGSRVPRQAEQALRDRFVPHGRWAKEITSQM